MSESLRNDGRVWVPKKKGDTRPPSQIPEDERDYYLERRYPSFGNLVPRDVASRAAKERIDAGYGVGPLKNAVYLDFSRAMSEQGKNKIAEKYGNLFRMSARGSVSRLPGDRERLNGRLSPIGGDSYHRQGICGLSRFSRRAPDFLLWSQLLRQSAGLRCGPGESQDF